MRTCETTPKNNLGTRLEVRSGWTAYTGLVFDRPSFSTLVLPRYTLFQGEGSVNLIYSFPSKLADLILMHRVPNIGLAHPWTAARVSTSSADPTPVFVAHNPGNIYVYEHLVDLWMTKV